MEASNFIPVRLVGSQGMEDEIFIGDFPAGIVLAANTIQDVRNGQVIAFLSAIKDKNKNQTVFVWEVGRLQKKFDRLFAQVMPQDAPVTVTLDGQRKRFY